VRDHVDVLGLDADRAARRVRGVRWAPRGRDAAPDATAADLVVDASGRTGRAAGWFRELGWAPPEEEEVEVDLRYATTHLAAEDDDLAGTVAVVCAATPATSRGGVAIRQEDGTWVVTLFGFAGERPPLDADGFRAFARTLPAPELAALLDSRALLEPPRPFRFAACRRRRFERLRAAPQGYLVIGDALCSFDPTFGQGMSVAALEAEALRAALDGGAEGLPQRYHRAAAGLADRAWSLVVGADLQIPGVRGDRPTGHAALSRYVGRVHRAAHRDPVVAAALLRVTNLVDPPTSLMAPPVARRVLTGGGSRAQARRVASAPDRERVPLS
jgi:flavin-dependent dehydrogenase